MQEGLWKRQVNGKEELTEWPVRDQGAVRESPGRDQRNDKEGQGSSQAGRDLARVHGQRSLHGQLHYEGRASPGAVGRRGHAAPVQVHDALARDGEGEARERGRQ